MRRSVAIVGAVALAAALSYPVAAKANVKQTPVAWTVTERHTDYIVEQQTPTGATQPDPALWVVNPDTAVWDPDDYVRAYFLGAVMDAGATATGSVTIRGDHSPHMVWLRVPAGTFTGRITFGEFVTIDIPAGGAGCVLGPQYAVDSPLLEPVAGSNGGVAHEFTVTFSLTNIGTKRVRDVAAEAQVPPIYTWFSSPCPDPFNTMTRLYPAGNDPQVWVS